MEGLVLVVDGRDMDGIGLGNAVDPKTYTYT